MIDTKIFGHNWWVYSSRLGKGDDSGTGERDDKGIVVPLNTGFLCLVKVDSGLRNGLFHRHAIVETHMVAIDSGAKAVSPKCGKAAGLRLQLDGQPSFCTCSPWVLF